MPLTEALLRFHMGSTSLCIKYASIYRLCWKVVEGSSACVPDLNYFPGTQTNQREENTFSLSPPSQGSLVFTTGKNTGSSSLSKQDCLSFNQQLHSSIHIILFLTLPVILFFSFY